MKQLDIVLPELPYAVEEAMNRLRVNIKFCGKNTKKILLTSCVPNEGKTTVSTYLWKMLAEAGFPTVLVDVDLRKSVMMKRLQADYKEEKGLNHHIERRVFYGIRESHRHQQNGLPHAPGQRLCPGHGPI